MKVHRRNKRRGICHMRGLHTILLCIACAAMADGAVASSDYIVKHGDTLWVKENEGSGSIVSQALLYNCFIK